MEKLGLTYPVVSDEGLAIAGAFGVRQEGKDVPLPATFVLDDERRVVWRRVSDGIVERPTLDEVLGAVPGE